MDMKGKVNIDRDRFLKFVSSTKALEKSETASPIDANILKEHHNLEDVDAKRFTDMLAAIPSIDIEPTWINTIKDFFTSGDIYCMKVGNPGNRFDLSNYADVKDNAPQIFGITLSQQMPASGKLWDLNKSATFYKWMLAGCPFNSPEVKPPIIPEEPETPRLRRSFTDLVSKYPKEFEDFKKAFRGIMALDKSDPNSYFNIASYHGLPGTSYCWHHFSGFIPWHRQYTMVIEDALRSIPGCENVTMPFWDQKATNGIAPKVIKNNFHFILRF